MEALLHTLAAVTVAAVPAAGGGAPSELTAGAIVLRLAAVIALVAANAFFVAAEFALVSVRRSRVEELASRGNMLARGVQKALTDIDRYIATTQLGITVASLALGWVGEGTLAEILAPALGRWGAGSPRLTAHAIAITVAFIVITYLEVVLGELVPKGVALRYPEPTALWFSRPLQLIVNVMRPLTWLLRGTARLVLRLFGIPESLPHQQLHTVEELKILVDASHKGGVLDETEREILHRVFRFSDVMTRQVMVHRTQMQCVPDDITFDELAEVVEGTHFSRLPVYEGSIDNIVGVLHLKDLFRHTRDGRREFNVREIMHEPVFVPETLSIELLLNEFKRNRAQMAIVLDEFGGTAGLVTLKDVLDEIVGHIQEEYEQQEEPDIVRGEEGVAWIKGHVRIDDLNAAFDMEIEEPDVDTVGGLVMNRLGRMPVVGDEVCDEETCFRVEAVNGLRVSRVSMRRQEPPDEEANAPA